MSVLNKTLQELAKKKAEEEKKKETETDSYRAVDPYLKHFVDPAVFYPSPYTTIPYHTIAIDDSIPITSAKHPDKKLVEEAIKTGARLKKLADKEKLWDRWRVEAELKEELVKKEANKILLVKKAARQP